MPIKINSFEKVDEVVIEEMEKRDLIPQDTNTFRMLMKAHLRTFIKQFNKHVGIDSAPALLKALDLDNKACHQLLQSDNLKPEMREVIYASMNEEMRVEFLLKDYHIPATVLEQFKLNAEQLHELAGKVPYARSIIGLLKTNKESLTEELLESL